MIESEQYPMISWDTSINEYLVSQFRSGFSINNKNKFHLQFDASNEHELQRSSSGKRKGP